MRNTDKATSPLLISNNTLSVSTNIARLCELTDWIKAWDGVDESSLTDWIKTRDGVDEASLTDWIKTRDGVDEASLTDWIKTQDGVDVMQLGGGEIVVGGEGGGKNTLVLTCL